jgi:hypothetical protein
MKAFTDFRYFKNVVAFNLFAYTQLSTHDLSVEFLFGFLKLKQSPDIKTLEIQNVNIFQSFAAPF